MDEPAIATIPKSKNESIRVAFGEYQGARFVDLRVIVPNANSSFTFTKRGICIPFHRLPAVIDALQRALDEARAKGLFGDHREAA